MKLNQARSLSVVFSGLRDRMAFAGVCMRLSVSVSSTGSGFLV